MKTKLPYLLVVFLMLITASVKSQMNTAPFQQRSYSSTRFVNSNNLSSTTTVNLQNRVFTYLNAKPTNLTKADTIALNKITVQKDSLKAQYNKQIEDIKFKVLADTVVKTDLKNIEKEYQKSLLALNVKENEYRKIAKKTNASGSSDLNKYEKAYAEVLKNINSLKEIQEEKYNLTMDTISQFIPLSDNIEDKMQQAKSIYDSSMNVLDQMKIQGQRFVYNMMAHDRKIRFAPVRNFASNSEFYNSSNNQIVGLLKNSSIYFGDKSVGFYTEFINLYAGPIRLGFGGLYSKYTPIDTALAALANVKDSTLRGYLIGLANSQDSLNRRNAAIGNLLTGGGNVQVVASWPLFDISSNRNRFRATGFLADKFALTIPQLGTELKKVNVLNDLSFEFYGCWNATDYIQNNVGKVSLSFFAHAKGSFVAGTKSYMQTLTAKDKATLGYFSFEVGVTLFDNLRLFYSYAVSTNKDLNSFLPKWRLGFNITPTKL
jgi:hypothetical protein